MEAKAHDAGRLIQEAFRAAPSTRQAFRDVLVQVIGQKAATGESGAAPDREVDKPTLFVTITDKGYEELHLSTLEVACPPLAAEPSGAASGGEPTSDSVTETSRAALSLPLATMSLPLATTELPKADVESTLASVEVQRPAVAFQSAPMASPLRPLEAR